MKVRTDKLREAAEVLVEVSRFPGFLYKKLTTDWRWVIYYRLREGADEIESLRRALVTATTENLRLRNRLLAIYEIAEEGEE